VSFADDLATMLNGPFGVSISAGGVSAKGILNQPSSFAAGDSIIYTDYVLFCESSKFGSLVAGDAIAVNSVNYVVRDNQADLDNLTCEISLSKV